MRTTALALILLLPLVGGCATNSGRSSAAVAIPCPAPSCAPGTVRWQVPLPPARWIETEVIADGPGGFGSITLTVAGDAVFLAEGPDVRALDLATGRERWHRQVESPRWAEDVPPIASAAALVYWDHVLSVRDGHEVFRLDGGGILGHISISDSTVVRRTSNLLVARDARTGRQRWQANVTPGTGQVIGDQVLYLDDDTVEPHITNSATLVQRVDLRNGRRLADLRLPAPIPAGSVLAALDGTVVVGEPAVAIDAASGSVRWRARARPNVVDAGRHRFCELDASQASCYDAASGRGVTAKGYAELIAHDGASVEVSTRSPTQVSLIGKDFTSGQARWRSPAFSLLQPVPFRQGPEAPIFTGIACADTNYPTWQFWPSQYRCADTRLVAINW